MFYTYYLLLKKCENGDFEKKMKKIHLFFKTLLTFDGLGIIIET